MARFIKYQQKLQYWLTCITVCRFYLDYDTNGNLHIRKSGKVRLGFYYLLWINSLIKLIYLVLVYHGILGVEVHFLDQMSMWDWFLCLSQLVQELNMWYRKYPIYEILSANWVLVDNIYKKLGSPVHIDEKVFKNNQGLARMHTTIMSVGCSAIAFQFFMDPKFAMNTYAILTIDNFPLRILFAAHEYFFIFHIWVHQASSIMLCEVFAVSYTHILNEMAHVMHQLIELGQSDERSEESLDFFKYDNTNSNTNMVPYEDPPETEPYSKKGKRKIISSNESSTNQEIRNGSPSSAHSRHEYDTNKRTKEKNPWRIKDRFLDPRTIVPGTEYDIGALLADYRKVIIATNTFNSWAGKLMGGTMASNYGQFVSDVFMMIQLLKEPDTDILGVCFFFEDACAGMLILFRMLILISRMSPSSESFLHAFQCYLQYDMPGKKYMLKYQKTLRKVATKLGGYSTKPITVPKGVNALMNYYIGAAMWKRPVDRRT